MGLGREAWHLGSHLQEPFSNQNQNEEFNVWHYSFSDKQLQKNLSTPKYLVLKEILIKKNLEVFKNEITQHLRDPKTKMIKGIFRNNEVFHHFNSHTIWCFIEIVKNFLVVGS